MVSEKHGLISNDYNLLKPPIGKGIDIEILGAYGEVRKGVHKVTN